ncbi:hypothetical protein TPHA_0O00590 [Tetrapisispora phaffii CBS 4417]|uniref:Probable metalloreductase AIM14 n=1 Tax=Tetrapisispora phaffii (strain ATCC 24235 / CBS 4417 / NBRC 1672 / NRRL Y-8282 / UCD 70-5) TaxID=1071381 RepID=G8C1K1_TETPH|nr:hypothetical protein TPHA_0O00590 [Tetrapisispora phaffii CBS 4417]CCE66029.1 hypothetical protein TPHA_0O00590 [Tetrapisispora phaffii CBS 4417]
MHIVYCFLLLLRRYVVIKENTTKIVRAVYDLNPYVHMLLIGFAIVIPFYDPKYSKPTVFFKRLGRLSYVLITLNLILMLRPNWLLTKNYTYTDFIPIHKWLSRFIVIISLVHGIAFLIWWKVNPSPTVSINIKLQNNYNAVGLAISIISVILMVFSLGPLRRWNYNVFYILHNFSNIAFVFFTPIHARPGVSIPYFIINITILAAICYQKIINATAVQLVSRESFTHHHEAQSLVCVKLERKAIGSEFIPACHIRISSYSIINPLYWLLPSHPYTVISLPTDDHIELVLLEHISKSSFRLHMERNYTVVNEFNPSVPKICLTEANRICITCAGTGISFGLPLYRYFLKKLQNGEQDIQYIKLVWIVKHKMSLELFEKLTSITNLMNDNCFLRNIEVYITNSTQAVSNFDDDNIELQDMNSIENSIQDKYNFGSIKFGRRIDWATDLSTFVDKTNGTEKTWLLACGPDSFVKSSKVYASKSGINFASEPYSF